MGFVRRVAKDQSASAEDTQDHYAMLTLMNVPRAPVAMEEPVSTRKEALPVSVIQTPLVGIK